MDKSSWDEKGMEDGFKCLRGCEGIELVRKKRTDVVVEIALAEDEFSELPFDCEDVGKDSGDGGCDLDAREIESSRMGIGCVLEVCIRWFKDYKDCERQTLR